MIVRPLGAGVLLCAVLLESGCGCHSLARRPVPAPAVVSSAPAFGPAANPNYADPIPPAPAPVPPSAPTTAIPGGYR